MVIMVCDEGIISNIHILNTQDVEIDTTDEEEKALVMPDFAGYCIYKMICELFDADSFGLELVIVGD